MIYKYVCTFIVAVLLTAGYGYLANQNNWWPHQAQSIQPIRVEKTLSEAEEKELIEQQQRIAVMAEQYYSVKKTLPPSMADLHTWLGVTLTDAELGYLSENLLWRLNSKSVVEVCIIPRIHIPSSQQCKTAEEVTAELSGAKAN